jgi:hypothetical protein
MGAFSFYFLSILQYQLHFIFLLPYSLGIVIGVDLMERYGIDPIKIVILSITMTGFFLTISNPAVFEVITLPTGGFSIKGNNAGLLWIQIAMAEPLLLYVYYCVQILIKSPKHNKKNAVINLVGAIISGPIPFLMNFLRLGWTIPGITIIFVALGTFISSYAFYRSSELLEVLITSSNNAKYNLLAKILPMCANCKKIRDRQGDWHPLEEALVNVANLNFTHGICEDCAQTLYLDLQN